MNVRIKRVDKRFPLPAYQTDGAVAFDLYIRTDITIPANGFVMAPTNIVVDIPKGYALYIAARSGTAKKRGLVMRNGVGIIDQDYHGDNDEIHVLIQNLTNHDATVNAGERIAQAMFVRVDQMTFTEVDTMHAQDRGGFGSTGEY